MRLTDYPHRFLVDHVIRHPNVTFGGAKKDRDLTFAETPLSAITRFTWRAERTKAPCAQGSSFQLDAEQSTESWKEPSI